MMDSGLVIISQYEARPVGQVVTLESLVGPDSRIHTNVRVLVVREATEDEFIEYWTEHGDMSSVEFIRRWKLIRSEFPYRYAVRMD